MYKSFKGLVLRWIIFLEISSCGQFHFSSALSSVKEYSQIDNNEFTLTYSRGTRDAPPTSVNTTSSNIGGSVLAPGAADKVKADDGVKTEVAIIKARPPSANYTKPTPRPGEESFDNFSDGKSDGYPGQPKFDENAAQRALIVVAFLAFVVLVYLGAKFMLTKKTKKVDKRYGRIESEIDLLDEMEDQPTDEEEELFDVNATRRSNF